MKKFKSFLESRKFARNLNLKSQSDWYRFIKGRSDINIPTTPHKTYKKQWVSWMDWLGYEFDRSQSNRKHKVNELFFDKWSYDMAYILGLWFADGCITKGDCFQISLHQKDEYLLEKIKDKMNSDHKLSKYKNCHTLHIYSLKIYNNIKSLGGKERKSLDVNFPNIPSVYIRDFIRGYFDGDGCICYSKSMSYYVSTFVSGSESFSKSLFDVLKKEINGLKGSIRKCSESKNGYYRLYFNKIDTIKLGEYMYSTTSDLYLFRKKELFKKAGLI